MVTTIFNKRLLHLKLLCAELVHKKDLHCQLLVLFVKNRTYRGCQITPPVVSGSVLGHVHLCMKFHFMKIFLDRLNRGGYSIYLYTLES